MCDELNLMLDGKCFMSGRLCECIYVCVCVCTCEKCGIGPSYLSRIPVTYSFDVPMK